MFFLLFLYILPSFFQKYVFPSLILLFSQTFNTSSQVDPLRNDKNEKKIVHQAKMGKNLEKFQESNRVNLGLRKNFKGQAGHYS